MDKNKTNQCDGSEDVGPTGPDMEEIMGKTLRVSLHDLLLCLGTLSSSEDGRCRSQLNPSASLLDDPVLSERHLGSPAISSPLQLSNPFFLHTMQQALYRAGSGQAPHRNGARHAGHFGINKSSPFLVPPHLLSTYNGVYFKPPAESLSASCPYQPLGKDSISGSLRWIF